ncbi:ABC transporter permease [Caldicellulosiruptor acetigenus]|uniref:ABC transporter permease n=1 Tax=Caldicellulosiruptor acetigenus TaxID=301953 RepID=UPI00054E0186|nr:ABC transporter permease subunit [Caldicellulosiruptor acetigenus]WAM35710.1 ABC transporter permease subunit [Caldicellulosiruptor acetigenus]
MICSITTKGVAELKKNGFWYEIKKNKVLYAMFLPVAIYYILFAYIPMGGIVLAFKEFNYRDGILFSPWNGFKNFEYFFASGRAWLVTKNTILYNLAFLAAYTVFSVACAIFIAELAGKIFKKFIQSVMFLPYFVSWVVVAAMMYNFFNYDYGLINTLIKNLGGEPIDIYSNPTYWYFLLPMLYVWKWVGYGSVLYLAAIMGFDEECYEAAIIDGANIFQRIFYITIPMLKPTMIILILLALGRILRGEFDMFYQIIGNNGLLLDYTDIIDTLVFRSLMQVQDIGMASAAGAYQSVLCFVIIMLVNWLVRRYDKDYALF